MGAFIRCHLLDLVLENEVRVLHRRDLRCRYVAEVKCVAYLVIDLVFNLREHILHVHYGTLELKAIPRGAVDVSPRLHRRLLILLERSLRDSLQVVVVEFLVRFEECPLALLQFIEFKVLHQALHHADLIALRHQLESFVFLVLALSNIVRQRVANLGMVQIALARVIVLVHLLV